MAYRPYVSSHDRENHNLQERSAPLNFIQPDQLQTVIVHAEMTLKESEGRTVLRALREESIAAVTVGVTRTPQLTITGLIGISNLNS